MICCKEPAVEILSSREYSGADFNKYIFDNEAYVASPPLPPPPPPSPSPRYISVGNNDKPTTNEYLH